MVVKVGKKEWDVNDCTYAERRELHKLNANAGCRFSSSGGFS